MHGKSKRQRKQKEARSAKGKKAAAGGDVDALDLLAEELLQGGDAAAAGCVVLCLVNVSRRWAARGRKGGSYVSCGAAPPRRPPPPPQPQRVRSTKQ